MGWGRVRRGGEERKEPGKGVGWGGVGLGGVGSVFPFSKHFLGRPLRGFRSQMQGDQGTAWGQPRAQLGHN